MLCRALFFIPSLLFKQSMETFQNPMSILQSEISVNEGRSVSSLGWMVLHFIYEHSVIIFLRRWSTASQWNHAQCSQARRSHWSIKWGWDQRPSRWQSSSFISLNGKILLLYLYQSHRRLLDCLLHIERNHPTHCVCAWGMPIEKKKETALSLCSRPTTTMGLGGLARSNHSVGPVTTTHNAKKPESEGKKR